MKVKQTVTQGVTTTKNVILNAEQFIQAVALLVIAAFSYWALQHITVGRVAYWGTVAALVVVGLRGTVEFVKFLDRK